jgi:nitronate monooxygenase
MDRRRFLESAAMGAAASAPIMKAVTARSAVAATPLPWETFVARMGMQVPIVQAPSGGTTWPCAPAVANAGGMGALGLTWSTEADAVAAIRAVKAATAKPFLINYALGALSSEPKTLPAVLAERVPVVSFSWGDPAPYAADVKRSGAGLGMQISSVEGLELAKQAGCDFVICQGVEAGGHVQATRSLGAVLPSVLAQAEGNACARCWRHRNEQPDRPVPSCRRIRRRDGDALRR